jgi:anti-sigma B factor antagonist
MKMQFETRKDCLFVTLEGEFVFDEVVHFESFIKKNLGKSKNIAIDMKSLGFMDSSGMGSLVKLLNYLKQKGGAFYLYNIKAEVLKILEIADLLSFFKIVKESEVNSKFAESFDDIMKRL